MRLKDMIIPNRDFQTSINIDYDFGSRSKIEGLIPTDSVCRYLEEIIKDVVLPSNQRAKLLVGAYGKGKSHVVLAAITAMWTKDPTCFRRIVEAYRWRGLGFGDTFERFVSEGKRLLPVVVSGSTSDLRHSLLHSLKNALKNAGLASLMPQTNYDGALQVLDRWQSSYPDTAQRFEELTGSSIASISSRLRSMDTAAYEQFVSVYPELTSGSTFDSLDGAEVIGIYETVLLGLRQNDIDGIYVVYDEFSKYLETSIDRATVEDTKLLQDFAEMCNRSSSDMQLHLLLISHKSLSNYIDSNLPKEKVDGWRGVSGRFREIEMIDDPNQYYELLSSAIMKNEKMWTDWLAVENERNERFLSEIGARYKRQGLFDESIVEAVAFGCFPLHPITTFILTRMSEKVAQNERTLFTFICSNEENSLGSALEDAKEFVTPDYVYGYFEPLLRKEFYSSPLHKIYELAKSSLQRVEPNSLEAKIIRTIAAIDIVGQYDRLAPTKQAIIELFVDCGYGAFQVDAALERLVESDSVVYLRRSNSFLKLKETSGVKVDEEISNRAEQLRSSHSSVQILNSSMRGKALYPSRYNEERGMVRYFDCGFIDASDIEGSERLDRVLKRDGDGEVLAIHSKSNDELALAKDYAKEHLSKRPMTVVVFPREHVDVDDILFRLAAARQLKQEAEGDTVLAEEYEIVVEDYSEIVDDYVSRFFQPELGKSLYYVGGKRRNIVTRKRRLSEELSTLCEQTYGDTPRITNESLNKNELTGTAFSSRTKILKALCAKNLEPNLGFVGNGQETSMARSAFERTGIIEDLASSAATRASSPEHGIDKVLATIASFIENAQSTSFSTLYDDLTGPKLGIGLRRGPIPLYIAYVLRDYRDEIKITFKGEEKALNETLLDDISKNPADYELTRLNWSPEMASYLRNLAEIFDLDPDNASRADVAEAIRHWYVELPQLTRNGKFDHTAESEATPLPDSRRRFFGAIRRFGTDSNVFLFDNLPEVFGMDIDSKSLIAAIKREKNACDSYMDDVANKLIESVKRLFDPEARPEASLGSVLHDWADSYPSIHEHVFSGVNSLIISSITASNGDDRTTVKRLSKAATSLRIEDWNDDRFLDFFRALASAKNEVESIKPESDSSIDGKKASIMFISEDGTQQRKTFDIVECGSRSKLLKNSIVSALDEMGGSLRPEEKRQIVFEVLKELC